MQEEPDLEAEQEQAEQEQAELEQAELEADEDELDMDIEDLERQQPRAAPSVKPGLLTKAWQACYAPFASIRLPAWNLRLFSWLLLALIVLVFLASNWSPMRLHFFGLPIEVPKALSVIVLLAVGFLAGWFWRYPRQEREE